MFGQSDPTKILFLNANPSDTEPLRLDEEIRLIGQRIRRGEYRKLFAIQSAPAIRATDLRYELMDNAHRTATVRRRMSTAVSVEAIV